MTSVKLGNSYREIITEENFLKSFQEDLCLYDYGFLLTKRNNLIDSKLICRNGIIYFSHNGSRNVINKSTYKCCLKINKEKILQNLYLFSRAIFDNNSENRDTLDYLKELNLSLSPEFMINQKFELTEKDGKLQIPESASDKEWSARVFSEYKEKIKKYRKNIIPKISIERDLHTPETASNNWLSNFVSKEHYEKSFKEPIIIYDYSYRINKYVYGNNFNESLIEDKYRSWLFILEGQIYLYYCLKITNFSKEFVRLTAEKKLKLEDLYLIVRDFSNGRFDGITIETDYDEISGIIDGKTVDKKPNPSAAIYNMKSEETKKTIGTLKEYRSIVLAIINNVKINNTVYESDDDNDGSMMTGSQLARMAMIEA